MLLRDSANKRKAPPTFLSATPASSGWFGNDLTRQAHGDRLQTGYGSPSGTLNNGFTYLAAPVFTDDPLVAGATVVLAHHLLELRQSVDSLRAVAGLSAATWTDATVTSQVTLIQAVHIVDGGTAG